MHLLSLTRERFARVRVSVSILNMSNAALERTAERSEGTDALWA